MCAWLWARGVGRRVHNSQSRCSVNSGSGRGDEPLLPRRVGCEAPGQPCSAPLRARWRGEGRRSLCQRDFGKCGRAYVVSHGEGEFCSCINCKQRLMLYRAPGGIWFALAIQRYRTMRVPAKCKFVFCLIMTSLS